MTSPNLHELQVLNSRDNQYISESIPPITEPSLPAMVHETEIPSLPPTDHGRQAYLVLAACTLIQAPIWGFSLSFGVFQEYYSSNATFSSSPGSIAIVGTTLNGLMYLMMPVSFTLLTRYPYIRPYTGLCGLFIMGTSFILSSFSTQFWQLFLTQGILCAIGCSLLFSPTSLYLDSWFVSRKGLAYGTIWAGKSAAGVVFPFIMSSLLSRFGAKVTLQAYSIALAITTAPLLWVLKPRIPFTRSATPPPLSFTFLRLPAFWMLQLGNVIQSLGYLLPTTYLSSYAHTLGYPAITGALLIAVFSLASIPGALFHGILGDKLRPTTVILISSLGSTIASFVFWGLATGIALLAIFTILYGFFAGGFSSTYSGVLRELKEENERNEMAAGRSESGISHIDTGLVMGFLLGARGVGFLVAGPLSSAILGGWKSAEFAYGSDFGKLVVFTGVTAFFGSWGWMWKRLKGIVN
ncbi:hypothetical protein B7494_g2809 [Chlorociboria aeruginascens]|nr:hypothetical protein B7494_g2809 [Chlorociboria aeruginascens]